VVAATTAAAAAAAAAGILIGKEGTNSKRFQRQYIYMIF